MIALHVLPQRFSVCQVTSLSGVDWERPFVFVSKTDEELSLVCESDSVPADATTLEDGFCAMRIEGVLDFSLIGIIAGIAQVLADHAISLFAISTYNTDYVLVKQNLLDEAITHLRAGGYHVER